MAAQQRSFQENIDQLTEKLEKERANILREQDKMLEHKLKVSQAVPLGACWAFPWHLRKGW